MKRQGRYSSTFIICLLSYCSSLAQSYNFKNYTVENGLSYIHIHDIFQDKNGYLWTGGYGGLSRFDGLKFTNYSPRNGLVHYSVQAITQDSSGKLIIGTIEGLSVYQERLPDGMGNKFKNYTRQNGLLNEHVNTLAVQGYKVAIGTDSGLYYLKGDSITVQPNLRKAGIKKIKSRHNHLLGITSHKVFYIGEKLFTVPFSLSPQTDTLFNTFEYDKDGTVWLGTNKGLFKIAMPDSPSDLSMKLTPVIPGIDVTVLYADKKNSLWIGTHEKLLNYTGTVKEYTLSKEYNANDIISITSDYEQNIWIGTLGGLFKFRDEGFVSYGLEDGLKSAMIYPIVKDKKEWIWFGTEKGGMYSFDGKTFTNYNETNGLPGNTVRGLVFDTTGRLWIATEKGLCIKENTGYTKIDKLQNLFIQSIYLDKQNDLWVGLTNGIARIENVYQPGLRKITFMGLPINTQAADHLITAFCGDEKGNVWMASFISGLYKWDGKKITNVTNEYKLQTRSVSDIAIAKDHRLYVATLDGIYIVNTEKRTADRIREEDGLNSNLVYSLLLTDNDKTLWAGTNQRANKIDIQNYFDKQVKNIISFGKTEGFKGVECNTGGLCLDKSGALWFGTVDGIIKHSPVKYIENNQEPRLSFTNFKLFYDDTLLPQNSVLSSSSNNISFQYTGICLTNPEKVRYIHKLEGFDKSWSPATNQSSVTYSNLPPGKYNFAVRCCNNQGVWTSTPLAFSFTVTPPLWQRWWFILCELALIGAIILLIFRIRLNQIRKEQELESRAQVEIAKNELKALRAQMNPHFLFNSLNSIQHFIVNHKADEAVFYLNRFARLMRMILGNSQKASVTLQEEIDSLRIYIELEKMRFNDKFEFEIKVEAGTDPEYEQIPTMLIQPYVENAVLHGLVPKEGNGLLKIHFFMRENSMHVIIEDNGIGRRRSAEINRESHKAHASMGMKITQDRLKLLSDVQQTTFRAVITDLADESGKACGTRVEITWPLI